MCSTKRDIDKINPFPQYKGLWHEAEGDAAAAEAALLAATRTDYGGQSPDYMTGVARVHCLQRGWPSAA